MEKKIEVIHCTRCSSCGYWSTVDPNEAPGEFFLGGAPKGTKTGHVVLTDTKNLRSIGEFTPEGQAKDLYPNPCAAWRLRISQLYEAGYRFYHFEPSVPVEPT